MIFNVMVLGLGGLAYAGGVPGSCVADAARRGFSSSGEISVVVESEQSAEVRGADGRLLGKVVREAFDEARFAALFAGAVRS